MSLHSGYHICDTIIACHPCALVNLFVRCLFSSFLKNYKIWHLQVIYASEIYVCMDEINLGA